MIDEQQECDVHQNHKKDAKGLTLRREGVPAAEHKEHPRQVCTNAAYNCDKAIRMENQENSIKQRSNKNPAKKVLSKKVLSNNLFHKCLPQFFVDSCAIINDSI